MPANFSSSQKVWLLVPALALASLGCNAIVDNGGGGGGAAGTGADGCDDGPNTGVTYGSANYASSGIGPATGGTGAVAVTVGATTSAQGSAVAVGVAGTGTGIPETRKVCYIPDGSGCVAEDQFDLTPYTAFLCGCIDENDCGTLVADVIGTDHTETACCYFVDLIECTQP